MSQKDATYPELPRYEEVARVAYQMWHDFVAVGGATITPSDIVDRRARINSCAVAFFRFCVQQCLGVERAHVTYANLSVKSAWPGRPPASWLWHAGNNEPLVFIDIGYVTQELPIQDLNRTATRLLLHETGHVVRHWAKLRPKVPDQAKPCRPDEEEEAWWFCQTIVSLAVGFLARAYRTGPPPGHDQTWRFV